MVGLTRQLEVHRTAGKLSADGDFTLTGRVGKLSHVACNLRFCGILHSVCSEFDRQQTAWLGSGGIRQPRHPANSTVAGPHCRV